MKMYRIINQINTVSKQTLTGFPKTLEDVFVTSEEAQISGAPHKKHRSYTKKIDKLDIIKLNISAHQGISLRK